MKFHYILFAGFIVFSCHPKEEKIAQLDYPMVKSVLQSVHEPTGRQNDFTYNSNVLENSVMTELHFNRKGQLLRETISDADGILKSKTVFKYDRHDNPVQWEKYMPNGWMSSRTTSEYNEANKLIERTEVDATDMVLSRQRTEYSDGKQWIITYQKINGNLVKTLESAFNNAGLNILNNHFVIDISQNSDAHLYTMLGNQTMVSATLLTRGTAVQIQDAFDPNIGVTNPQMSGPMKMQEEHLYDPDGNLIETLQYFPQTNKQITIRYKYEKNRMEVATLSNNQMVSSKKLIRYDDNHNLVESFKYSLVGRLQAHERHLYEYDAASNWVLHKTIINNKSRTVVVRKIEYF